MRFYSGHFPLVATELLGGDFLTMTMLRDPVDRTVSFLKHMKRRDPRYHELTLEQIYEDDLLIQMFVLNHQAKLFSLTREDEPEGYFHLVVVDDSRLERAKERLQTVDVIGFTERLDDFAREVTTRFGLRVADRADVNVSEDPWEASPALRERIREDNAKDVQFFAFAQSLAAR